MQLRLYCSLNLRPMCISIYIYNIYTMGFIRYPINFGIIENTYEFIPRELPIIRLSRPFSNYLSPWSSLNGLGETCKSRARKGFVRNETNIFGGWRGKGVRLVRRRESYDRYKLPWLVSIEGVHPLSGVLRDNLLKEFLRFTSSASVLRDSLSPNGFPCACLLMANEGEERSLRPRKGKKIVNGLARIPFFRSSD